MKKLLNTYVHVTSHVNIILQNYLLIFIKGDSKIQTNVRIKSCISGFRHRYLGGGGEFQPDMYQFYTHRVIQSRVCKNLHYVNINLAKQNTLTHIYLSYRIRATLKVSSKTQLKSEFISLEAAIVSSASVQTILI